MPKTLSVSDLYPGGEDKLACQIETRYTLWRSRRTQWEREKQELRDYIFATDTTKTTNSALPWKNTTTIPKLCQLRDNLHANYMAALFPNDDWFSWEASDVGSALKAKAATIEDYMKTKLNQTNFQEEVSKLVLDYIDFGNAFGQVEYISEIHTDDKGQVTTVYQGPRLTRISPYQIVFDISARDFDSSPKITRALYTMGDLEKMMRTQPEDAGWIPGAMARMKEARTAFSQATQAHSMKEDHGFAVDGFGSLSDYYSSGYVEVLEFEGDLFDVDSGVLYENHRIIIGDKKVVLYKAPFSSWLGKSNKKHAGWRLRPDNLMAAGPLDNLVGMQYRIDHLENLKADVFDQIACPVVYQKGQVEEWSWGPGQKIYGDTESDVSVLAPDATALNADFQIERILNLMEELAGAPRSAMGIRTPGEKTAYEVQTLENAAGRIFQSKVTHFERHFIEPVLNAMLEASRRNLQGTDSLKSVDDELGATLFTEITAQDLKANGKLRPMGARHFAQKAQAVQNLNGLMGSAAWADQGVRVHFSGKAIAQAFEDLLGVRKFKIVRDNAQIPETLDTQRMMQASQDTAAMEGTVATESAGMTPAQVQFMQQSANVNQGIEENQDAEPRA